MMDSKRAPRIGVWVLVLALSGFIAGFVGPIIFVPEANQGPLVGIFITGPLGAVLGIVLDRSSIFFPVSDIDIDHQSDFANSRRIVNFR